MSERIYQIMQRFGLFSTESLLLTDIEAGNAQDERTSFFSRSAVLPGGYVLSKDSILCGNLDLILKAFNES